jgi:hypothetical protein
MKHRADRNSGGDTGGAAGGGDGTRTPMSPRTGGASTAACSSGCRIGENARGFVSEGTAPKSPWLLTTEFSLVECHVW